MSDTSIQERPPHQQRVLAEREARFSEYGRLQAFIAGGAFASVAREEQALLKAQAKCMGEFVSILDRRISLFSPGHTT